VAAVAGLAAAHRALEIARERGVSLELALFEGGTESAAPYKPSVTKAFSSKGGPDSFLSEKPWALASAIASASRTG